MKLQVLNLMCLGTFTAGSVCVCVCARVCVRVCEHLGRHVCFVCAHSLKVMKCVRVQRNRQYIYHVFDLLPLLENHQLPLHLRTHTHFSLGVCESVNAHVETCKKMY